jgi:hypothetical protein
VTGFGVRGALRDTGITRTDTVVTVGTCRLKRKSLSPIFSVRSCTSSALSLLLSLSWSCSPFLVGVGVCLYVARPFLSSLHALIHALFACVLHHLRSVVLSGSSWRGASAGCCLRPSSLHPVASFGGLVSGLVSWDARMGWYPSDPHVSSLVLEFLDLSRDPLEDVGA